MSKKSILIVTGTFNNEIGKESYFGTEIFETFKRIFEEDEIGFINGGSLSALNGIFHGSEAFKIIVWMPLIDNSEDKYLGNIKKQNPTAILIQSKRNDYNNYTTFQIVERMFAARSNLCLEISKAQDSDPGAAYNFRVLDPLGNLWYKGSSITIAADRIAQRVKKLNSYTRYPSIHMIDESKKITNIEDSFIAAVRSYGWRFSALINHAINKERFLGNASTRCMVGFPSQKINDVIFVSKRNIDKGSIHIQNFVPVTLQHNEIWYYGEHKPSVDSAVQVMLFNYYHNVKYIIHGHTYVPGVGVTKKHIPCGYIEEFDEITSLVPDHRYCNFAVNLIGHGCIILAENFKYMAELPMIAREFPEDLRAHGWE